MPAIASHAVRAPQRVRGSVALLAAGHVIKDKVEPVEVTLLFALFVCSNNSS